MLCTWCGAAPVQEYAQDAAAGVAAVSAVGGGSVVSAALQLVILGDLCVPYNHSPPRSRKERSRVLDPLQLSLEGRASGLLFGNVFLVLLGGGLAYVAARSAKVAFRCLPSSKPAALRPFQAIYGRDYFCNASLLLLRVLYPGMVLGGLELILAPDSAALAAVGALGLAACVALPVVLHRTLAAVPKKAFIRRDPETVGRPFVTALLGYGEWISVSTEDHVAARYSSLIRTYKTETVWFACVEIWAVLALSAHQALHLNGLTWLGCGHVAVGSGAILTMLLLLKAYLLPCLRGFANVSDAVTHALQIAAMGVLAAGYYAEDPGHYGFAVAGPLLVAAAVITGARAAVEALAWVYVFVSGRRRRLQDDAVQGRGARGPAPHRPGLRVCGAGEEREGDASLALLDTDDSSPRCLANEWPSPPSLTPDNSSPPPSPPPLAVVGRSPTPLSPLSPSPTPQRAWLASGRGQRRRSATPGRISPAAIAAAHGAARRRSAVDAPLTPPPRALSPATPPPRSLPEGVRHGRRATWSLVDGPLPL
eukprot:TRINITY_DN7999_c0_g1_i2.p1 TRINITY_DN7999_c0_g1~~TRINITY_DN7999_c0_g1_i2.p1  ORF type:complete len:536 (+),score=95.52 TRINITY_DN7999_c0_g1_i2:1406-3013(+)